MTDNSPTVKSRFAAWRADARQWCIERPITGWFLVVMLGINYVIDLAQSFL
jgi:hypothetical protein